MPLDRLLPLRALTRILSVPAATIRDWISTGEFPGPVILPNGRQRWRASEVATWQARLGISARVASQLQPAEPQDQEQQEVDIDSLSELAQDILQALTELEDGWQPAKAVAAKVGGDADSSAGNWGRAIRELREARFVRTGKRGVRLTLGDSLPTSDPCPTDDSSAGAERPAPPETQTIPEPYRFNAQ